MTQGGRKTFETNANYGYRWYKPSLQRWLNRDPIGEEGGINWYGYSVNDPINKSDPLGLWDWKTIGSGIKGKIGFGPGVNAEAKISKLKVGLGVKGGWGFWGDLSLDSGAYVFGEASLIKIKAGPHQMGAFAEYYCDVGSVKETTDKVFGYKYKSTGVKSKDWFEVGASAHVLAIEVGLSVNFGTIWEGIRK